MATVEALVIEDEPGRWRAVGEHLEGRGDTREEAEKRLLRLIHERRHAPGRPVFQEVVKLELDDQPASTRHHDELAALLSGKASSGRSKA